MRMFDIQSYFEDCEEVKARSYSGRFMYGKDCLGIVGSIQECMQAIARIIARIIQEMYDEVVNYAEDLADDDDANELERLHESAQNITKTLLSYKQDNMGYDVILYWPDIEYKRKEE